MSVGYSEPVLNKIDSGCVGGKWGYLALIAVPL